MERISPNGFQREKNKKCNIEEVGSLCRLLTDLRLATEHTPD